VHALLTGSTLDSTERYILHRMTDCALYIPMYVTGVIRQNQYSLLESGGGGHTQTSATDGDGSSTYARSTL